MMSMKSQLVVSALLVVTIILSIALPWYPVVLNWQKYMIMTPSLAVEGGGSGAIGEPTVIYENDVWRMWYSCNEWHQSQTCYAESSDALHWTKFGKVTDQRLSMIVRYNSTTLFFYTRGLLTQYSQDGIHWTHFAQQYGVLPPNQPYDNYKWNPSVLQLPNGTWLMYYECTATLATFRSSSYWASCLASSPDGIHDWVRNSVNPVLGGRRQGFRVGNQDVLYDSGVYYMFWNDYSKVPLQIALSTSTDGVHWTQVFWKTSPLIARTIEGSRFDQIGDQEVVVRPDGIYVFYAATDNIVGYGQIWLAKLPNTTLQQLAGAITITENGVARSVKKCSLLGLMLRRC